VVLIVNHLQYVFDSSLTDIPLSCRHYLTDMIKGLKSNKTGKEFDARLSYSVAQKRLTCIFEK
ncbi:hypothetical protein P4160_22760, partial [Bacillus thuringiensis]|nr:hypothetical protein [Bacillus thuringiensis]